MTITNSSGTVNPTSLAAEPVTGNSCSGVTLAVTMGALKASVTTPGSYTAVPTQRRAAPFTQE